MAGAGAGGRVTGGGIGGQSQIINGQSYAQYSPQWYAARDAEKIRGAGVAGTAQGTGQGAEATTYLDALKKTGLPLFDSGGGSSSSSGGTGTGSSTGSPYTPPATIAPPSLGGMSGPGGMQRGGSGPTEGLVGVYDSFGPGGSRTFDNGPTTIDGPGGGPGGVNRVGNIAPLDTSAAQAAAFAHAKDQVGQIGQGSLTGLRSALGSRGMLGSGGESRATASVANRGMGELGDVARSQAIDKSGLDERTATTNYTGQISQRGQDVTSRGQDLSADAARRQIDASLAATGYTGAITQRGQDILAAQAAADRTFQQQQAATAQRNAMLQGLLGALGGSGRTY